MLERCHQLWAPRFCQPSLGLGSQNLLFSRLIWLQSSHIQLPAAAATASTDPDQECHYQESKNHCWTDQLQMQFKGCFDTCASMIKKDDRQYIERGKISSKKQK